jgi:hypothetical protein
MTTQTQTWVQGTIYNGLYHLGVPCGRYFTTACSHRLLGEGSRMTTERPATSKLCPRCTKLAFDQRARWGAQEAVRKTPSAAPDARLKARYDAALAIYNIAQRARTDASNAEMHAAAVEEKARELVQSLYAELG